MNRISAWDFKHSRWKIVEPGHECIKSMFYSHTPYVQLGFSLGFIRSSIRLAFILSVTSLFYHFGDFADYLEEWEDIL